MLVLIASFKALPGKETELEAALQGMIPKVQEEEGTLVYTIHKSKADASQFMFYEMYKDKAAFEFHGSTPYFKDFSRQIAGLLEGKPQLAFYEDIAAISR